MNNIFTFQGHTFEYFDHPHNRTRINERAVELPLVKYFLDQYPGQSTVEIGAVSPYYFEGKHQIYDLTDDHPRSQKKDALTVSVYDQALLSCSTLEHIGRADAFNSLDDRTIAPRLLQKWLDISGPYLITWPLGYHIELDQYAIENCNPKFLVRRPYPSHQWQQVSADELTETDKTYGTFSCANGIAILSHIF